jgi:hypothetical protein
MYTTTKSSSHSQKMSFMNVKNVVGALVSPKGITKNLYEPYLVQQVVFSLSPSVI